MVEKYGLPKSEAPHYCLVQSNLSMPEDGAPGVVVGGGTTREYILDDDDCPLNILMNHQVRYVHHEIIQKGLTIWILGDRLVFVFLDDNFGWKACNDSSQLYIHDQASKGAVTFHVRRRPSEGGAGPRRRKKKSAERDGPR